MVTVSRKRDDAERSGQGCSTLGSCLMDHPRRFQSNRLRIQIMENKLY